MLAPLAGQEENHYYGVNGEPVKEKDNAIEIKELKQRSGRKFTIRTYHLRGDQWELTKREKIRETGEGELLIRVYGDRLFPGKYNRRMQLVRPGCYEFRETRLERILREGSSSSYLPLRLEGIVNEYYPNGQLKSRSSYRNNQLISNKNWLADGTRYIDSVFYSVDSEPEYKLGNDIFRRHILESLGRSKIDFTQIEDIVEIGWVVMEDGHLNGVIPLRGKIRQLNEVLAQAISELPGSWEPARLNGRPVRYFMSVPFNFMQREVNFQDLEMSGGMLHYNRY